MVQGKKGPGKRRCARDLFSKSMQIYLPSFSETPLLAYPEKQPAREQNTWIKKKKSFWLTKKLEEIYLKKRKKRKKKEKKKKYTDL